MEMPYHFRCIADNGVTVRQSTVAFASFDAAKLAAEKADRITGDTHVVCVSLDPKDPENSTDPLKSGYKVVTE